MGIWLGITGGLVQLLSPVICLMSFYILYEEFRPLALSVNLNRKIVTSFILGSVFAFGSIPVFASGKGWMMSNMSGAVIPTFLALYLWVKNRLNVPFTIAAVTIVSYITYSITELRPELGIVATFPEYLIPIAVTVAISGVYAIWKERGMILPMSFTVACLGTLIGADLVRIPELVYTHEIGGNIGGARTLDLVLISPLLAFFFAFLLLLVSSGFSRKRLQRNLHYRPDRSPVDDAWIRTTFTRGYEALKWRYTGKAIRLALSAVRAKMWYVGKMHPRGSADKGAPTDAGSVLGHSIPLRDYRILEGYTEKEKPTSKEAYDSLVTASLLMEHLDRVREARLAPLGRRVAAFLTDQVLIIVFTVIIMAVWMIGMTFPLSDSSAVDNVLIFFFFPFSIWASIQLPYYILFEYFWKKTPGKRIFGLTVMELGREKPSIEAIFARNIGRYFDMALLFYLVPLIIMGFSKNRQRFGDMVGDTVVARMPKEAPRGMVRVYS